MEQAQARRLKASGVPARFRGMDVSQAKPGVREWVERVKAAGGGGEGLVLFGPRGTGKTADACAALADLAAMWPVAYATSSRLIAACRDFGVSDPLAVYRGVTVLLIDDIGAEAATNWGLARLLDVVDARWAAEKPTVFTCQTAGDELVARLTAGGGDRSTAEAIVSRMRGCSQVRYSGPDMRASR